MTASIPASQLLGRLNWRYATKKFDLQRKIGAADWTALEDALVLTASSGGLQPWHFLVVDDPAVRQKLLPAAYGQVQVVEASHLVVFAGRRQMTEADVDKFINRTAAVRNIPAETLAGYRGLLVDGIVKAKDQPAQQAWAARQTYIALGNLLAAAALMGIDAGPMEGFDPAQFDAILGLEAKGLASSVICVLGYRSPTDAYASQAKVRYAKADVLTHI
jgi:nitroreductase